MTLDRPRPPAVASPHAGDPARDPASDPAGDPTASATLTLADDRRACGTARHWATTALAGIGIRSVEVREDAELIVSELVSNAVQHGAAPIVVTLSRSPGELTVSVADAAGPPHHIVSPASDPSASHGRGLTIIATVTSAWGVRALHPGPGKLVWGRLLDTGA